MEKLVVLKLDGELAQQGVRVTLEIGLEGERPGIEVTGKLPSSAELLETLQQWQQSYRRLGILSRITPKGVKYAGSVAEEIGICRRFADILRDRMNIWLNSPSFHSIDATLREELSPNEAIRVLIRAQDMQLHQLPWQLWSFLDRYNRAEFALSAVESRRPKSAVRTTSDAIFKTNTIKRNTFKTKKVRILAILGHAEGINVQADRKLLECLPHAEVVFLVEPQRQEINDQLWDRAWDILFFAGHSESEGDRGWVEINPEDRLTMEELKYCLKRAIDRGLQLVIFNSCDGLGLVRELEQLQLPRTIVMRETVPDVIAQAFLKYFLTAFAQGNSLHLAERQARERLHVLEPQFPCASWLPVLYQHPAAMPLTWEDLCKQPETSIRAHRELSGSTLARSWKQGLRTLILVSIATTSLVVGVRLLGWLQSWELKAFDRLMMLRPSEGQDSRLLIVTIDEADIQAQDPEKRRGSSLSDAALNKLLKNLEQYQPRIIALDIYRDFPAAAEYQELGHRMQHSDNFIAVCKVDKPGETPGIAPPPEVPGERLGFSDIPIDPDGIVRRQLLGMAPSDKCNTSQSFSLKIALRYLADEGIAAKRLSDNALKIGDAVFQKLEPHTGGYRLSQGESQGYQVLLNYRSSAEPGEQVALTEVLEDRLQPELVRDRIVLVGNIAHSTADELLTPYGSPHSSRQTPGLIVQAQMVSQMLSAVLDDRPLLSVWPQWVEILWVLGWACLGGGLALCLRSPIVLGIVGVGALNGLSGICLVLLIQGVWVPWVPAGIALIATGGSVRIYYSFATLKPEPISRRQG